ncbi:MAG: endonuclease III [Oscillospiraceae bacterium]
MTKKEIAQKCVLALKEEYPNAICSLNYEDPFELLISVRLSAQCTDARVNLVVPALFAKYRTLDDYANADLAEVERLIHSCGFYHNKAKDIISMATMVRDEFGGVVPDNIDDLIRIPGVGRKTANLICGDVYGKPAVVTDTHLIRISNRIGLVETKNTVKIERELRELLPPQESNNFCHRIVLHGRAVCTARKAMCEKCCLESVCKKII